MDGDKAKLIRKQQQFINDIKHYYFVHNAFADKMNEFNNPKTINSFNLGVTVS
jgi:hypothetical protein